MEDLTATEAAKRFSEVLDAIEHRGESFVILRRGKPVAKLTPASRVTWKTVVDMLRRHPVDEDWLEEVRDLRAGLQVQERPWLD